MDKNIIGSSCITSFCKDNNGMLWVGTDNDGIYALTEKLEPAKHFSHTNHPNSVPSTVINYMKIPSTTFGSAPL